MIGRRRVAGGSFVCFISISITAVKSKFAVDTFLC